METHTSSASSSSANSSACSDWINADHAFLRTLAETVVEAAAEKAVRRDPFARQEGSGVWNRSRAPHCYGYEYEQHFGSPISLLNVSKEHEKRWRQSSWWPNVPPVEHFYDDYFDFPNQCMDILYDRAKARYQQELEDRKRRKKAYDLSYNKVRRKRRKTQRRQRQKQRRTAAKDSSEGQQRRTAARISFT